MNIEKLKELRKSFPIPVAEFNAGGECERVDYDRAEVKAWLKLFDDFIRKEERA